MKLAIMQPYFFPYIGYFQLINAVEKYIIYDNLNFIKDAWVNRNNLLLKNSGSSIITVPLIHKSSYVKIRDIEIDDTKKWREKLKKTIYLNYHQSPMYDEVFPILESVIDYSTRQLSELNINIIITICRYLKLKTPIEYNSGKYQHIENLLLDAKYMSENYHGLDNKVVRIFEICKKEKANIFINAIGGIKLYNKDLFAANKIQLYFIKMQEFHYEQFNNTFIPNLSIIDVLMFNRVDRIQELLNKYELV